MSFEQFVIAYIKSEILTPRNLVFVPTNYYEELFKSERKEKHEKSKKRKGTV